MQSGEEQCSGNGHREELEDALRLDRRLSADRLDVSVDEKRVVLEGEVQSHLRKLAALRIAEASEPELRVEDRVRVAPVIRDDPSIARDVNERFAECDAISHETITVRVRNGRARLAGLVATDAQRVEAEDVAMSVAGVRATRNLLIIDAAGQLRDAERSRSLRRQLRDELGGAAEGIRVVVSGPTVVLEGDVPERWYARRAGEVLRLAGVLRVKNRLEVHERTEANRATDPAAPEREER